MMLENAWKVKFCARQLYDCVGLQLVFNFLFLHANWKASVKALCRRLMLGLHSD